MYKINLNAKSGLTNLKSLINEWNDGTKSSVSVVLIKISKAFTMYHQVSPANLTVRHQKWTGQHPIIVNDLDTHNNVVLVLNTNGIILHYYIIDDRGHLKLHDDLSKVAPKNVHEEYLDYFYCIAKNIESCVKTRES